MSCYLRGYLFVGNFCRYTFALEIKTNNNAMNNATISISKTITKITGNKVQTTKLTNLPLMINGLDVFTFTGLCCTKKINKYIQVIEQQGYKLSETVWFNNAGFEGKNADTHNFNMVFVKA